MQSITADQSILHSLSVLHQDVFLIYVWILRGKQADNAGHANAG